MTLSKALCLSGSPLFQLQDQNTTCQAGFGRKQVGPTVEASEHLGVLRIAEPVQEGSAWGARWDLALTQHLLAGWGNTGKAPGEQLALPPHLAKEEVETTEGHPLPEVTQQGNGWLGRAGCLSPNREEL